MTELRIEIRPGEGGEDARLLVDVLADIYRKFSERMGFTYKVLGSSPS